MPGPTITTQPLSQTIDAANPVSFLVVATGTGPLSYQWLKNAVNIPGAVRNTYELPLATVPDSGAAFTVNVTDNTGTTLSSQAILSVAGSNDLSADEYALFFEIFGLSENLRPTIITSMTHIPPVLSPTWMATYTIGDLTNLVDQLYLTLAGQAQAAITRARIYLTLWDSVGGASPMELTRSAAGDEGPVVISAPKTRNGIIRELSNIIGFAVPTGGFYEDITRRLRPLGAGDGFAGSR